MERLTERTQLGSLIQKSTASTRDMIDHLGYYEDLEDQLKEVFGECDGLLETAIGGLLKYNSQEGPEVKPVKATLLTDEDAEEWEVYKKNKTEGLNMTFPCKLGDVVYWTTLYGSNHGLIVREEVVDRLEITRSGLKVHMTTAGMPKNDYFGERVFLTPEAAQEKLEQLERNKK